MDDWISMSHIRGDHSVVFEEKITVGIDGTTFCTRVVRGLSYYGVFGLLTDRDGVLVMGDDYQFRTVPSLAHSPDARKTMLRDRKAYQAYARRFGNSQRVPDRTVLEELLLHSALDAIVADSFFRLR